MTDTTNPVGIIINPQFDLNEFRVGRVVKIKFNSTNSIYECIITKAEPLMINLIYYLNNKTFETVFSIDDYINGRVEFEFPTYTKII